VIELKSGHASLASEPLLVVDLIDEAVRDLGRPLVRRSCSFGCTGGRRARDDRVFLGYGRRM
jgi:hypothetical protein